MKSEKSKVLEPEKESKKPNFVQKVVGRFKKQSEPVIQESRKDKKRVKIQTQKQKDAALNRKLVLQARIKKIFGVIGQFFVILFILAVILSMVAIPLLLVFG